MIFQSRNFNKLSLKDDYSGVIRKESDDNKLVDEIYYYLHMPREIKKYFPRIFDCNDTTIPYHMDIEYYPYDTLSHFLIHRECNYSLWSTIFRDLQYIIHQFKTYKRTTTNFDNIYLIKNEERLNTFISSGLTYINENNDIIINDVVYPPLNKIFDICKNKLKEISYYNIEHVIHGDLCFTNILCSEKIIRLIDPRGRFNNRSCYGDIRYDIAKLSHSVNGGYDFILNNMYSLNIDTTNKFRFQILNNYIKSVENASCAFQEEIIECNDYNRKDIYTIEAWLFLSMLPLHSEDYKRQLAFLITGLQILRKLNII